MLFTAPRRGGSRTRGVLDNTLKSYLSAAETNAGGDVVQPCRATAM